MGENWCGLIINLLKNSKNKVYVKGIYFTVIEPVLAIIWPLQSPRNFWIEVGYQTEVFMMPLKNQKTATDRLITKGYQQMVNAPVLRAMYNQFNMPESLSAGILRPDQADESRYCAAD